MPHPDDDQRPGQYPARSRHKLHVSAIVLTGRQMYTDEALSSGLVRHVVAVREVVDAALEIGA